MIALGSGWRAFFIGAGVISIVVALWILRLPDSRALRSTSDEEEPDIRQNLSGVLKLLRRADVWRWLVLLEFSDLILDVLFSLLALYMVDVAGVSQAGAGLAIAVWTGVGLVGDFLLIPILERVRGLVFLRFSAVIELVLFPLFLLIDPFAAKLVLLGLMGLFNPGWYAILQSKLYDALGEQSGAVLIVGNAAGVFGAMLPVFLGFVAQRYGLDVAMWFLIAGPIALLIGLPRD
jgi:FSR family fosmidomycin resistance protein-like MFS transporter